MQRTAEHMGIFRFYNTATHGYYYHVTLSRNGVLHQRDFHESRCGGTDQACKLAHAWRDLIVATYQAMPLAAFCAILRSNNTSGIPGVSRTVKGPSASNDPSRRAYWQAHIPLGDGKGRVKGFSVYMYGEEEAKRRAIAARMQGLQELEGVIFRGRMEPQGISTQDDMAQLQALLRKPAERQEKQRQQALARNARRHDEQLRAEQKLAQEKLAEQTALAAPINRSGEPYISRATASAGTSAYWRVSLIRQGVRHRKSFTDSTYGNAEHALAAARAWRDALFLKFPLEKRATIAQRITAANTSGVTGVSRSTELHKGTLCHFWTGFSPKIKGYPRRGKKFSVAKYGEEEAFALAVQARAQFVATLNDARYGHHRAARKMMHLLAPDDAASSTHTTPQ